MSRFPALPPGSARNEREPQVDMAEVSLDSIVFLFQVLMALALTNGAYVFITNASGGYSLRPWSSYTLYQSLAFLTFVATLVPFAHANVIILKQSYGLGFGNKGLNPLVDFSLLFLEAGLFYTLSHALARIEQDPLSFFYVAGAILGVDVLWALVTVGFDRKRSVVLIYAYLNSITLLVGALLVWWRVPYLRELLLLALAIRTALDFSLTYNLLFPDAFNRVAQPLQRGVRGVNVIRNLSVISMLLIGIPVFFPIIKPSACGTNCGLSDGLIIPLFFIGLIMAAIAWILAMIRAASLRQWAWLVCISLYTTLMPLAASGVGLIVSVIADQWLHIAGAMLYFMTPFLVLMYGLTSSNDTD